MLKLVREFWDEAKEAFRPLRRKRTRGAWIFFGIAALFFLSNKQDDVASVVRKLSSMGPLWKSMVDALQSPALQVVLFLLGCLWMGIALYFAPAPKEFVFTQDRLHELQDRHQRALSNFDPNNAFEIDAQAVSNLQNQTELARKALNKPGWSLDCEIGVRNLHPTQGFDEVAFRLQSIMPSIQPVLDHHPATQDTVLRRVQFAFSDTPKPRQLLGDQTGHIMLFRAEKYLSFSETTVLLTFNGSWPENVGNAFSPKGEYEMTVEVAGSGVGRKEQRFILSFFTEEDEPVFSIRKTNGVSTIPPILTEKQRNEAWEKDQERRGISITLPRKREQCLMAAAQLLKSPAEVLWSFNAICRANAEQLDSNDDVAWVCDELARRNYDHPFFGLENHVPKEDWREFVREAKLRITTNTTGEYVRLAEQWWAIKGYPQPSQPVSLRLKVRLNILGGQGA